MTIELRSPYPYHGAKTGKGAALIWKALGNPPNTVVGMAGALADILARPKRGKMETVNDTCGFIPNVWRAIQHDPEAVAYWADWPVSELDMHATHKWLVEQANAEWIERIRGDIDFYDAKIAGRWVWGISIWIGGEWCAASVSRQEKRPAIGGRGGRPNPMRGVHRPHLTEQLPHLNGCDGTGVSHGRGINRGKLSEQLPYVGGGPSTHGTGVHRKHLGRMPHLAGPNNPGGKGVGYGRGIFSTARGQELAAYFAALQERFRSTRFTCGDFERVLSPAVTTSHGLTGVILDPPYGEGSGRKGKLYVHDDATVAARARKWAIENGENPLLRIVLAGYAGEHDGHMPRNWRCEAWKSHSGYANADRERIWMSPHCLGGHEDLPLFAGGAALFGGT
ncbi:MAG TPA: hypothetical protein VFB99_15820 [Vicinamibacterales bacterium]|nr:hypothetical protein [Vicinamibacterales bacterium]